jgi:tetratricopeptide (TPR) repeat protein
MLSESIKHYRQSWDLTQEQFAEKFDVVPRSVQRWESGVMPRTKHRQKLAPCEKAGEDQMKRRDFFQGFLATSLTFATPSQVPNLLQSLEIIAPATARPSIREELSIVETLTKTCWQLLPHVANAVDSRHLNYIQGYRRLLESWLKSSPGSSIDLRLTEAIGEIAQVEATLFYATKHLERAEKSYLDAIRAAHESGNLLLEAVGLAWFGNFLIDTSQANRASAPLEAASLKAKRGGATPTVKAWIAASQADAWARQPQKDVYNCEVALGRAETFASSIRSGQEPYPVPYDSAWSLGYKGSCYVRIGRLQEAKAALEQGVRLLGTGMHRRAAFYKDFVIAHSLEKNVEAACSSARLAIQIAKDTKAPMELQDAQDAMQEFLQPWKDSSLVKSLSEEFRVVQQELVPA